MQIVLKSKQTKFNEQINIDSKYARYRKIPQVVIKSKSINM